VAAFGKTHYYHPRRHEFDICLDWEEYQDWLGDRGTGPLPLDVEMLGPWRPFYDPPDVWLNAACLPYPALDANMYGTYLARQAAKYLTRKRTRPFFQYVSFYETHSPFAFPVEFRGRQDPLSFNVPDIGPDDWPRLPKDYRKLRPPTPLRRSSWTPMWA
jgi:choline-sulfatase